MNDKAGPGEQALLTDSAGLKTCTLIVTLHPVSNSGMFCSARGMVCKKKGGLSGESGTDFTHQFFLLAAATMMLKI